MKPTSVHDTDCTENISKKHADAETAYQDALSWIHSSMRFGSKLGLERILCLLEFLGNPQKHTRFIHIAGTNGKGSVAAMVASILKEAGYRTGMYISPYLEDYRERIMINGKMLPKNKLASLIETVRPAVERLNKEGFEHPTEFEINTALAFLYFSREDCDYVVLEVGMGGRFDATNVIIPDVSVITTIDYDHVDRLGNTLAEIAFEKAGIIKPCVPVVTGVNSGEASDVIRKKAAECGSMLVTVGTPDLGSIVTFTGESPNNNFLPKIEDTKPAQGLPALNGQTVSIRGPGFSYENLHLPLLGEHQLLNAALAVAALETICRPALVALDKQAVMTCPELPSLCHPRPVALDEQAVRAGIAKTIWPGRLEVIHKDPVIILDGAHNPQGAKVLSDFMKKLTGKRIICIYGMLSDKSFKESASLIAPLCDTVITTRPETPRALDPEILGQEVRNYTKIVLVEGDPGRAVELALSIASSEDVILVCGSLYLVGPVRTYIRNKFGISAYGGE